jgi:hypothetical protein
VIRSVVNKTNCSTVSNIYINLDEHSKLPWLLCGSTSLFSDVPSHLYLYTRTINPTQNYMSLSSSSDSFAVGLNMYNVPAFLVLLFLDTLSSSVSLPYSLVHPGLSNQCTFMLWHKQMINATAKTNYIQLHEIQDHANNIIIDLLALVPVGAHNSYFRISAKQVFAVEGLLDNSNLTIKGEDGSDEVRFEYDGVWFSSIRSTKDAWCSSEGWDSNLESGLSSRVRLRLPKVLRVLIVS